MYGLMFGQTEFDRCVRTPQEGRGGQSGGRGDVTMHAFSAAGEHDLHTVIKPRNTERIRRSLCERVGVCARLDANR